MTSVTTMVLFIGYHATARTVRDRIQAEGLRAHKPVGNLTCGVYVFNDDLDNMPGLPESSWCVWSSAPGQDVWRVAYCGPMIVDPLVRNAVILPDTQDVTLVTGNA